MLLVSVWSNQGHGAGSAKTADGDPADSLAVEAVCGRCHPNTAFLNSSRPWIRWNDVFGQMTARGATGTDEQLVRVTRYFLQNLTIVNVNTSPVSELAPVLGVSIEVADRIIDRRERKKFSNLADLADIQGINQKALQKRKDRIQF